MHFGNFQITLIAVAALGLAGCGSAPLPPPTKANLTAANNGEQSEIQKIQANPNIPEAQKAALVEQIQRDQDLQKRRNNGGK